MAQEAHAVELSRSLWSYFKLGERPNDTLYTQYIRFVDDLCIVFFVNG